MIDYTQLAFASAPQIDNPIPSVADYMDQYEARNRAWYEQWAYPLEGGGYGSRPESFVVRAPWQPPETAVEPPPVVQSSPPLTGAPPESTEVDDRPLGAITPDPAEMTDAELIEAWRGGVSPKMAQYGAGALTSLLTFLPGAGLLGGYMAGQGVRDYQEAIGNELGRRMGSLYPSARTPFEQAVFESGGTRELTPGGPRVFTGGDVLPAPQFGQPSEGGGDSWGGGWSDPPDRGGPNASGGEDI